MSTNQVPVVGPIFAPCAVAALPVANASLAGVRGSTTAANAALTAAIGAVATTGTFPGLPVYCNGTDWRFG